MLALAAVTLLAAAASSPADARSPARASLWLTAKGTRRPPRQQGAGRLRADGAARRGLPHRDRGPVEGRSRRSRASAARSPTPPPRPSRSCREERQQRAARGLLRPRARASATASAARTSTAATSRARATRYAEPGDVELRTFSVAPDRRFRLPFIKAALAAAGGPVKIYASPWSPPAWMKTNGDDAARRQAQARVPRRLGPLLRALRPGVREGRRADVGPHGAERAHGHADLGEPASSPARRSATSCATTSAPRSSRPASRA